MSATLPHEVLEMTHKFMTDPVRILVKRDELTLEVRGWLGVCVDTCVCVCVCVGREHGGAACVCARVGARCRQCPPRAARCAASWRESSCCALPAPPIAWHAPPAAHTAAYLIRLPDCCLCGCARVCACAGHQAVLCGGGARGVEV